MRHISSYIAQGSLKQEASHDHLTALWYRAAPVAFQQRCRPTRYQNNCLVLEVESSVWLSRVRQKQQTLIRHLQQDRDFASLSDIRLVVSPRQSPAMPRQTSSHHKKISSEHKEMLLSSASDLSDPELKRSLQRLAETASGI